MMRSMFLGTVFLAVLLTAPPVFAQQGQQFPQASETTPQLIELWEQTNSTCRGQSGNDVSTWAACAARSVYGTALNERDWCFGHENDSGAEMEWHQCDATSLRFDPVDIDKL